MSEMWTCARCNCLVSPSGDCHIAGYCSGGGGECGCPKYVSKTDPEWRDRRIEFLEKQAKEYTDRYVKEWKRRTAAEDIVRRFRSAYTALWKED